MATRKWQKLMTGTAIAFAGAVAAYSGSYSNFQVNGNARIEDSVVLGVAGLTPGKAYSDAEVNSAVQRLYASGLFSNVEIVPRGSSLTINVAENASVGRVFFEGNESIKDAQLSGVVKVGPRSGLDRAQIEQDAQEIRRLYAAQSRLDAQVRPVVIPVNNGVYNVVYEIDEGTISNVNRVTFTGNQEVSDWVLRRTVTTGESSLFGNLYSRDNFASEKLLSDQEKLQNYYQEHGYYNAQVRSVDADYNALGNYYLSYAISEGRKYNFGSTGVSSSVPGVTPQRYADLVEVQSGKVYKASNVRDTIQAIETQAAADGFPFLRVQPVITPNEANGTLNVDFNLVQGPREYVERIDIHGNDSTVDRVIRRQFDIVEGDPMNERKVQEAQQRLQALGYFSKVAVTTRETSVPGKKIIDVDVEEANTGTLNFGGSYSDGLGFSVFGSFSEENFMGRGQYVKAKLDWGKTQQSFDFSFTEPGFYERDLAAGFDLYYTNTKIEDAAYQSTRAGFEPRLSFPVSENSRLNLSYFLRSNEIRNVNTNVVSPLIADEKGQFLTSGISANWMLDRTNASINPTRGFAVRLGSKLAGLGGDAKWYQVAGKAKMYYPIYFDNVIFTAELEGGHMATLDNKPIRSFERFNLGGDNLLGFGYRGIGPRDYAGNVNSALGGNNYAAFRTDLTFPLGLPEGFGIRGQVFYNAGSVWGLDKTTGGAMGKIDDKYYLRQAAGASLLWDLGGQNLRFSWSKDLKSQTYDVVDDFQISVAASF